MGWLSIILILGMEYYPTQVEQINWINKNQIEKNSEKWGEINARKTKIGYRLEIIDIFYLQNVIDTYLIFDNSTKFSYIPYHSDYFLTIGAKFSIQNATFNIGYEHLCRHPELTQKEYFTKIYGGYDKIFFNSEIKLK